MEFGLLEALGEDERRELLSTARRRRFARGDIVFHREDPADTLHIVQRGRFAVRIVTPLGDVTTLSIVSRGESFGELALLGKAPRRTATVVALETSETLSIHELDFARVRARNPVVETVIVDHLATRVEALSERLVEALYVPADRRVLRRVHELCELYGDGANGAVEIPLTQEDIAGLAGTARATVNRVLRHEERRGTIERRRGRTVVLDVPALAERAR